eukprot:5961526-Pyramimonas_sp.AAC.1
MGVGADILDNIELWEVEFDCRGLVRGASGRRRGTPLWRLPAAQRRALARACIEGPFVIYACTHA